MVLCWMAKSHLPGSFCVHTCWKAFFECESAYTWALSHHDQSCGFRYPFGFSMVRWSLVTLVTVFVSMKRPRHSDWWDKDPHMPWQTAKFTDNLGVPSIRDTKMNDTRPWSQRSLEAIREDCCGIGKWKARCWILPTRHEQSAEKQWKIKPPTFADCNKVEKLFSV